jgi:uncharacterized protein (TIGR02452 family)
MSLKGIAKETMSILEKGGYVGPSGEYVDISQQFWDAVNGTVLYEPRELKSMLRKCSAGGKPPIIEVTNESSQVAAKRLAEKGVVPAVLNFASARKPGGGFINGAKSQEEDLCRCSGLYPCLTRQRAYYDANRQESVLYTDHIIYSPDVPFFRERNRELIDQPFAAGVITAPAPNAGQARRRDIPGFDEVLYETLRLRAGMVLAVARDNEHRSLVLGAWGCGVFSNSPEQVAAVFGSWLENTVFLGAFDHVVFPVFGRSGQDQLNLEAFQARFES